MRRRDKQKLNGHPMDEQQTMQQASNEPQNKQQAQEEQQIEQQAFPTRAFWTSVAVAGALAIFIASVSWNSSEFAGALICLGALVKVISATIGAAAKGKELVGIKAEIEQRLGYFDAVAAVTAFPALFATGAEMIVSGSLPF